MNTYATSRRSAVDIALITAAVLSISAGLFLQSLAVGRLGARVLVIVTLVTALLTVVATRKRDFTKTLASVPLMFLMGLTLLNLGQTITEIFGFWSLPIDPVLRSVYGSVESLQYEANVVACIGILCFICGMVLAPKARGKTIRSESENPRYLKKIRLYVLAAWCVFMLVILVDGYRLGIFHVAYGKQLYDKLTMSSIQMALSCCVVLAAHTKDSHRASLLLAAICGITYGMLVMIGIRGHSSMFIYGAFAVWAFGNRCIVRLRYLTIFYVVGAMLWATIGAIRLADPDQRRYGEALANAGTNWSESLMYPVKLITGQEVSLRYGILYAQEFGVSHGSGYLKTIAFALPNLFGETREATDPSSISTKVSATFIRSYGLGFTPIAEAYCNGGMLGVCAAMFLAGLLLESLQQWAEVRQDSYSRVVLGLTLATILWWIRNDSLDLIRFFLWGFLLFLIFRKAAKLTVRRGDYCLQRPQNLHRAVAVHPCSFSPTLDAARGRDNPARFAHQQSMDIPR